MRQSEPYAQTRWKLDDLFPDDASNNLEEALKELDTRVAAFEALRKKLHAEIPMDDFLSITRQLESLSHQANLIYSYATLKFSEDTQDQASQALLARVEQFMAEMANRTLFFSLWWKALSDGDAAILLEGAGDLQYWLEEMRHQKPHTLSEPEEKIINLKNVTGASALVLLYDAITNRYVFRLDVDGEVKELTRGELMVYARHHDAGLRAAAYHELYRVYGQDGPILGNIYQALVRDYHVEQVTLRRYSSPIAARNLSNDLPDDVVDMLLEICRANTGIFGRYFRLKARLLGMERLKRSDLYAPLSHSDRTYPYGEAVGMVLEAFGRFHPQVEALARRVFDQEHLDSEVRQGKRSGAFCLTSVPDKTPWVLLNYQGRVDDVSTMAHELGHAVHSLLASHHSLFTAQASLPLAETASTFGEMLLVDKLLKEEDDEAVRRDLLFRQVDDSYATIQRQAFFALFERRAHDLVKQGASVDDLTRAYLEDLRTQFADDVLVDDEAAWEWVAIPHIYHTPFYVYAYSFGQLLVLSLYNQYQQEGDSFKQRYLDLLAAGGSASPETILGKAGVDIHKPSFWQGGFDIVQGWVERLEKM